jgi:hypothetical protein
MNPRTFGYTLIYTGILDSGQNIVLQVGNFLGSSLNHEQVALYNRTTQVWTIFDPDNNGTAYTASLLSHQAEDVPVAGKYLPGACSQLAVWRPSSQEFRIEDSPFTSCGVTRRREMVWGSKNDPSNAADDDVPLAMTSDGVIHRPTTYRPTKGLYNASIANGQWWVHDAFPQ